MGNYLQTWVSVHRMGNPQGGQEATGAVIFEAVHGVALHSTQPPTEAFPWEDWSENPGF